MFVLNNRRIGDIEVENIINKLRKGEKIDKMELYNNNNVDSIDAVALFYDTESKQVKKRKVVFDEEGNVIEVGEIMDVSRGKKIKDLENEIIESEENEVFEKVVIGTNLFDENNNSGDDSYDEITPGEVINPIDHQSGNVVSNNEDLVIDVSSANDVTVDIDSYNAGNETEFTGFGTVTVHPILQDKRKELSINDCNSEIIRPDNGYCGLNSVSVINNIEMEELKEVDITERSGIVNINPSNNYDVMKGVKLNMLVPTDVNNVGCTINTNNTTYSISNYNNDNNDNKTGFDSVSVNIPSDVNNVLLEKTIGSNGSFSETINDYNSLNNTNYTGFNGVSLQVNVPSNNGSYNDTITNNGNIDLSEHIPSGKDGIDSGILSINVPINNGSYNDTITSNGSIDLSEHIPSGKNGINSGILNINVLPSTEVFETKPNNYYSNVEFVPNNGKFFSKVKLNKIFPLDIVRITTAGATALDVFNYYNNDNSWIYNNSGQNKGISLSINCVCLGITLLSDAVHVSVVYNYGGSSQISVTNGCHYRIVNLGDDSLNLYNTNPVRFRIYGGNKNNNSDNFRIVEVVCSPLNPYQAQVVSGAVLFNLNEFNITLNNISNLV